MATTTIHISVEIDVSAMLDSAMVILGRSAMPPDSGTIEVRLFDAIKASIKTDVPHVVSVKQTDFSDC